MQREHNMTLRIVYPVTDLAQAKALYRTLLGVEPSIDQAYYVGFEVNGEHVGLDPNGHAHGMKGPISYWPVEDIDKFLQQLLEAGAQEHQPIRSVGGAKIAAIKDADGNVTGLIQAL